MKNYLKIDREKGQLIMDREFYKRSAIAGTREYFMLQDAMNTFPTYTLERRQIKKSASQEHYDGLTYKYMEAYIISHEVKGNLSDNYDTFCEMIYISKCHSKAFRYPTIKKWFLETYPEVKEYGVIKIEDNLEKLAA